MDPSIVSPVALRFNDPHPDDEDLPSNIAGRETPLPRYEQSQQASLPFTLNLQEDASNPGQFQLVINVGSKDAATLASTTTRNHVHLTDANAESLAFDPVLYQTQKASPPTTPGGDKQEWADLDNVTPDFLHKVVPDWGLKFARSDSTTSTHSRKLADIKARIKKTGKGYVVRLLKGSAVDSTQIAEVELGETQAIVEHEPLQELDSVALRAELDSKQAGESSTIDAVLGRADLFEIGTSNESGLQRPQGSVVHAAPSVVPLSSVPSYRTASIRSTITEEGLSDAETLVPEVRSIENWQDSEQRELDEVLRHKPTALPRSNSISSIVNTPTRGLSVVGSIRRVEKSRRARNNSTKSNHLNGLRFDQQKVFTSHTADGSGVGISSSYCPETASLALLERVSLRERSRSASSNTVDIKSTLEENNTWPHTQRLSEVVKPYYARRKLGNDSAAHLRPGPGLQLQTNIPVASSRKSSPSEQRKRSSKTASQDPASNSSSDATDDTCSPYVLAQPPKVDPSDGLREAVARALGRNNAPDNPKRTAHGQALPVIIEPPNDDNIGEISLPAEFELRSIPVDSRNLTLRFWSLAISALSDKVYEGFKILRDRYGAEPPVPQGHVRVRWICSCGDSLYDDFIEQRPNAARLFEAYLNRPRAHSPRSPMSQGSSASSMASIFDTSSRASTLATPSSTYGGSGSWGKQPDRSKYSPTRIRPNSPFSVQIPSQVEESWLLTCANEGRLTPKVVHLDVNDSRVKSDKDLALTLRQHYNQLNNHWYSWARLRGLTTIEFVQFEIHRNRFADIRATPSMPPRSASSASTSPGREKPQSPSQYPYTFEPNDLLPPVGSTYLLHLFQHPTDYDGELITYLRSPKRRSRLDCGMGWGVHLVEGFLAQKVWTVTMGVFGVGGAVFAILWAVRKQDVQGAFGIAQWMLGIAVLLLGALQAWIE